MKKSRIVTRFDPYGKLMINRGKFFKSLKIIFKYSTFLNRTFIFLERTQNARESHLPPLPYLPIMTIYFYPQGGRFGEV